MIGFLNGKQIYLAQVKLNRSWHLEHRMPTKATFTQRVKWHLEHAKHCTCRPIPARLLEQMKAKGIAP